MGPYGEFRYSITITVSFQHEYFSEFVKEYVSPVNINIIMKGRVL